MDANHCIDESERVPLSEPIYENIERDDDGNNLVPSDGNNKFKIYVNYDFIKGEKYGKSKNTRNKSSVRLLEPDVKLVHVNEDDVVIYNARKIENLHISNDGNNTCNVDDEDDNDEENNSKSMSKTIQCQQISMYIGENFFLKKN